MAAAAHHIKLEQVINELSKLAVDDKHIIALGWYGYKTQVMPSNAPDIQYRECQLAFYAGAQHLFASIMSFLEPGDTEPTEKDLQRMNNVAKELNEFVKLLKQKGMVPDETDTTSKRNP